jgi:RNA polymerase sigma-70 factor (ECF subfamily)
VDERAIEAGLAESARDGSAAAFRELVRRFERPVYTLVLRMVRDPGTAEELAQDVFVKAYRRLDTYDPERRFASWLFKIAHNTTIDHLRRSAPDLVSLEAGGEEGGGLAAVLVNPAGESPEAIAERGDLARDLERAISALRPEYRTAVVMRYQEGLSYEEISAAMGLPLGTIKTHLHRARKELAGTMRARGWAPETGSARPS